MLCLPRWSLLIIFQRFFSALWWSLGGRLFMTTSLPIGQLFSLHINIYKFTFYEQSRYMRIPSDQNAKYDPVIMAQQVKLPFTDTLQAGILLLSMHWESKRKCNFPRVTDSTVQIQSSNSLTPSPLCFLLSSLSPFCLFPLFLLLFPPSLPSPLSHSVNVFWEPTGMPISYKSLGESSEENIFSCRWLTSFESNFLN